jgi:hypothetical protein
VSGFWNQGYKCSSLAYSEFQHRRRVAGAFFIRHANGHAVAARASAAGSAMNAATLEDLDCGIDSVALAGQVNVHQNELRLPFQRHFDGVIGGDHNVQDLITSIRQDALGLTGDEVVILNDQNTSTRLPPNRYDLLLRNGR